MGASVSSASTITNDLTSIISSTIITSASSCGQNVVTSQNIDVTGNNNNINNVNQSSNGTYDFSCLSSSNISAAVSNALTNNISNYIKSQTSQSPLSFLTASDSSANTATTLATQLSNSIDISTSQTCLVNIDQTQALTVSGSGNTISGTEQASIMSSVAKCVLTNATQTSIMNNIADYIITQQQADASTQFSVTTVIVIIVVLIIILLLVYLYYKNKSNS